jgi:hypothetical protein
MPEQSPLEEALLNRQPQEDPTVTAALRLLPDNYKPTVPVRLYDNPDRLFEEVLKRFGPARLSKNAIGVVPIDGSAIYMNRNSKEFKDPYQFASKIAHEQVHVGQPSWGRRETPAYEQEVAYMNSNGARFKPEYRDAMMALLEKVRKQESSLPKVYDKTAIKLDIQK